MSVLEQYDFSNSVSVITETLSSLLSCSLCKAELSSSTAWESDRCSHQLCSDCHHSTTGHQCPVPGCTIPTVRKDFKENKSLSQVANCLSNIKLLLLNNPPVQKEKERKSGQRNEKLAGISELKDIAGTEVSGRKTNSRTRTRSVKVNVEKSENSRPKKPLRQSLPDKRKVTSKKDTSSNSTEKAKLRNNLEKKNTKGESKLHIACNKGSVAEVKELLGLGANPNTQDHAGWTPLHDVVSHNRLDLAELLLAAEAKPSVPSHDERTTALHDAVTSCEGEMVRLLVSRGADREAKDKHGLTPRSLAAQSDRPEIREILEKTKVMVNLNESLRATNSQCRKVKICLSKALGGQASVSRLCTELCQNLGLERPSLELSSSTTHLVVAEAESVSPQTFNYLAALAVGASIVRSAWLTESRDQGKIVRQEMFEVSFAPEDREGLNRVEEMISAQQPGLLAGIHFYLANNVGAGGCLLSRDDLASLVRLCGGRMVSREPDPEGIPADEVSFPHHAQPGSPLAETSHVILYWQGAPGEPQIKYNMKHIKTLPVTWLINCVRKTELIDP